MLKAAYSSSLRPDTLRDCLADPSRSHAARWRRRDHYIVFEYSYPLETSWNTAIHSPPCSRALNIYIHLYIHVCVCVCVCVCIYVHIHTYKYIYRESVAVVGRMGDVFLAQHTYFTATLTTAILAPTTSRQCCGSRAHARRISGAARVLCVAARLFPRPHARCNRRFLLQTARRALQDKALG